jgi:hypothetical protein
MWVLRNLARIVAMTAAVFVGLALMGRIVAPDAPLSIAVGMTAGFGIVMLISELHQRRPHRGP